MAFATPEELSAYTSGLISSSDPRAQDILDGATQAIQNYCGWSIAPAEDIEVYLDGGTEELYLPTLKLNSIDSITVAGEAVTEFEWSRRTGNVRRTSRVDFPDVYGDIVVAFNSGYAEVPADLKQIVLQVAAMALSSPTGATREQAGQVSMQWATTAPGVSGGLTLLERDYATLAKYVLPKEA
jgi:hypothetical protein